MARGCAQRPGEDFHEKYFPVVQSTSIRLVAAIAANEGLEIHHMDVTTAYLNGELEEKVFMELPDDLDKFIEKIQSGSKMGSIGEIPEKVIFETANEWYVSMNAITDPVCLLQNALYGLRQSGLRCYSKLTTTLREIGFKASVQDP